MADEQASKTGPSVTQPSYSDHQLPPSETQPPPGENKPGPSGTQPGYNVNHPSPSGTQPGYNVNHPGPSATQPGYNVNHPGPSGTQPGYNVNHPGPSETQPGYNVNHLGPSGTQPGYNVYHPGPSGTQPGYNVYHPGPSGTHPGYNVNPTPARVTYTGYNVNHPPARGTQPVYNAYHPLSRGTHPGYNVYQPPATVTYPGYNANHPPARGTRPGYNVYHPPASRPHPGYNVNQPPPCLNQPGFNVNQPGYNNNQPGSSGTHRGFHVTQSGPSERHPILTRIQPIGALHQLQPYNYEPWLELYADYYYNYVDPADSHVRAQAGTPSHFGRVERDYYLNQIRSCPADLRLSYSADLLFMSRLSANYYVRNILAATIPSLNPLIPLGIQIPPNPPSISSLVSNTHPGYSPGLLAIAITSTNPSRVQSEQQSAANDHQLLAPPLEWQGVKQSEASLTTLIECPIRQSPVPAQLLEGQKEQSPDSALLGTLADRELKQSLATIETADAVSSLEQEDLPPVKSFEEEADARQLPTSSLLFDVLCETGIVPSKEFKTDRELELETASESEIALEMSCVNSLRAGTTHELEDETENELQTASIEPVTVPSTRGGSFKRKTSDSGPNIKRNYKSE